MHSVIQDGCVYLYGEISMQTISKKPYRQFMHQCEQPQVHSIDFAGVKKADSTCVGLLLLALRVRSCPLKYLHIPDSVRLLIGLYEMEDWITHEFAQ